MLLRSYLRAMCDSSNVVYIFTLRGAGVLTLYIIIC